MLGVDEVADRVVKKLQDDSLEKEHTRESLLRVMLYVLGEQTNSALCMSAIEIAIEDGRVFDSGSVLLPS